MRQKLYLILCSFITTCAFSQSKGDNVIVIKDISFKEVVTQLLDKGYLIEKIDSNYQTIKTEKRSPKKNGGYYSLDIRVKDGSAVVKGKCFLLDIEADVENKGMKGSLIKNIFLEMDEFAKSFNKPIEYLKQ